MNLKLYKIPRILKDKYVECYYDFINFVLVIGDLEQMIERRIRFYENFTKKIKKNKDNATFISELIAQSIIEELKNILIAYKELNNYEKRD